MMEKANQGATLILGLGNVLMGDEGFGVHVVRQLKKVELPGNTKVVEGGVGGLNLLSHLEGIKRLLIIDVMMVQALPGELFLVKPEQTLEEPGKRAMSFHQMGALELVKMGQLLGHEPETLFLVTRPGEIAYNMELSPPLQDAVDRAVKLAAKLCANNFAEFERSQKLCIL